MTLQELLAQVLGGERGPVRLADGPESYRTRGQQQAAPITQRMASLPDRTFPRFRDVPRPDNYPFPLWEPRQASPQPPRSALGAYPSFADYANAELGLQTQSGMAEQQPVWRDPQTGALPNPTRYPGPADANMPSDDHGAALMLALRRAQANPQPVISPEERERARLEEASLVAPRRPALFPAWTRRGGPY